MRKTLEVSSPRKVEERKMKVFAGKQQTMEDRENKNDQRTTETKDTCSLKTCGGEKTNRENYMEILNGKENPLGEKIDSTELSEMINNSIRKAVRTIVKQCSMEEKIPISQAKESEKKSHVYRSGIIEKCQEKSSNIYDDRQISYYIPWQSANLYDKSQSLPIRTRENTTPLLPVRNKIYQDKMNKKHSKVGNNTMSTDNRRMTGNVNIYICSEANGNNERDKQNIKSQTGTDTSSITTIEQSHSRYNSTSSVSLCKLINSIPEKRRKSQTPAAFPKKKNNAVSDSSDTGSIVRDDRILHETYNMEPSQFGEEQTNTKVINENIGCENTVSFTKDGCCCKDITSSNTNLQQDSLHSLVPCSPLNIYDYSNPPESCTTICPAEIVTKPYDSDVSLSSTICINMERGDCYRENNVWRNNNNNNENTVCNMVDNNRWLSRPIYTDCISYGEMPETRLTVDNCKYRDRKAQYLDYKQPQEFSVRYRKEHIARRQWSVCSCITEEEEDYSMDTDRVEKDTVLGSVCNDAKQLPEEVSVCRTFSRKLIENSATLHETTFDNVRERSAATQTYKSSFRNSKDATLCRRTFENSKVAPKVTRVPNKFVVEESPRDITVCKTIFSDPKESLEEVTVCETVLPDSKKRPEETICKILNVNSVNQDTVERVSLRDKRDKLTRERTDNSNLNNRKKNSGDSTIRSDNRYNKSGTSDAVKKQEFAHHFKQNKQVEKNVNDEKKFLPVSVSLTEGSTSLLTDIRSTSPGVKPDNQRKLTSTSKLNNDSKDTSKDFTGQGKMTGVQLMPLLNQSTRNLQRSDKVLKGSVPIDFASNKSHEVKEETQEIPAKETGEDDKLKEIKVAENKKSPVHYKDSLLHRLFKKLTNIISEGLQSDRIETGKSKTVKTITNDKKDSIKPINVSPTDVKINDKKDNQDVKRDSIKPTNASLAEIKTNDKKDYQDVEKIYAPVKTSFVNKDITENTLNYTRSEVTAPVDNIKLPKQYKWMDVASMTQATRLKPKLLRIIAEKRLHPQRTRKPVPPHKPVESIPVEIVPVESVPVETPPVESIPVEIVPPVESVEINKIKQYDDQVDILQESVLEEDTERMEVEGSVVPKMTEYRVKDTLKMDIDERKVLEEEDKITKRYIACPQKGKELPKFILDNDAEVSSVLTPDCSCVPIKYTKSGTAFMYCKNNGSQRRNRCICSRLSMARYTCVPSLERDSRSCLRSEKNQVHGVLLTRICKGRWKKECRCKKCIAQIKNTKTIGTRKPSVNCINCCKPENKCCCTISALVQCYKVQRGRSCRKTMICLYCDNPRDKCICRAPIGKCSYCRLPLDICNCESEGIFNYGREQPIVGQSVNVGTIRVTSWKPNKEIKRYFARDIENRRSKDVKECRCCREIKRQCPAEELPYQRLNVFSDVMNELQRKMSESAFCTRCRKNPCCCGPKVDQDERKEGRKVKRYDRSPELKKSRGKSPDNYCQCSSSSKNRHGDSLQATTSINRNSCVCKLLPCKCKKRPNDTKPLAKCYYCKSLPCNCIVTS